MVRVSVVDDHEVDQLVTHMWEPPVCSGFVALVGDLFCAVGMRAKSWTKGSGGQLVDSHCRT